MCIRDSPDTVPAGREAGRRAACGRRGHATFQPTAHQGARPPAWLSTHPTDASRIAEIRKLIPRMMPLYQQARR